MIEQIDDLPAGVVGFTVHGEVTAEDYERTIVPDLEAMFALHDKIRLLYHFAPDFTGFETRAMWDDTKLGLRHFSGFERVAVVSDADWLNIAAPAVGAIMPGTYRAFTNDQLDEARAWLLDDLQTA